MIDTAGLITKLTKLREKKIRQLKRQQGFQKKLDRKHGHFGVGFTYFGGWGKGHVDGRVSQLHDQVDELSDLLGVPSVEA